MADLVNADAFHQAAFARSLSSTFLNRLVVECFCNWWDSTNPFQGYRLWELHGFPFLAFLSSALSSVSFTSS